MHSFDGQDYAEPFCYTHDEPYMKVCLSVFL